MARILNPSKLFCIITALCSVVLISGDTNLDFKDGVLVSETKFYLQKGQTLRITCPSFRRYDDAIALFWYRVTSPDGSSKELLLRQAEPHLDGNFSVGPRYQFAPDYGLVIQSVREGDQGKYQCQKVARNAADNSNSTLDVVVLDELFPANRGVLRQGRNITESSNKGEIKISCPIEEASDLNNPTIYWSREIKELSGQTEIVAVVYSDGESTAADKYKVSAGNALILRAVRARIEIFWCHVSSIKDDFSLQSANVLLEIKDEPNTTLIVVLPLVAILLLLGLLVLAYWKRTSIKRYCGCGPYKRVPGDLEAPTIDAGLWDKWIHEFNVGPRGNITTKGGEFNSLKSVAFINDTDLAVLDNNGVHIFGPDFGLREHFTDLMQPADNYVTMVSHYDKTRLLLGTRDGAITTLTPSKPSEETLLCSLASQKRDPESNGQESSTVTKKDPPNKVKEFFKSLSKGSSDKTAGTSASESEKGADSGEAVPLQDVTPSLSSISVDQKGQVFAADQNRNSIAMFDSKGDFIASYPSKFTPAIMVAGSANEFFVHDGKGNSPITLVEIAEGEATGKQFIAGSDQLKPVNLFVERSCIFVVSDTGVGGQREVFQYDRKGNFVRQFVKPWRGIRGLCTFQSNCRLALYDNAVIRIYRKETSENRV